MNKGKWYVYTTTINPRPVGNKFGPMPLWQAKLVHARYGKTGHRLVRVSG